MMLGALQKGVCHICTHLLRCRRMRHMHRPFEVHEPTGTIHNAEAPNVQHLTFLVSKTTPRLVVWVLDPPGNIDASSCQAAIEVLVVIAIAADSRGGAGVDAGDNGRAEHHIRRVSGVPEDSMNL